MVDDPWSVELCVVCVVVVLVVVELVSGVVGCWLGTVEEGAVEGDVCELLGELDVL